MSLLPLVEGCQHLRLRSSGGPIPLRSCRGSLQSPGSYRSFSLRLFCPRRRLDDGVPAAGPVATEVCCHGLPGPRRIPDSEGCPLLEAGGIPGGPVFFFFFFFFFFFLNFWVPPFFYSLILGFLWIWIFVWCPLWRSWWIRRFTGGFWCLIDRVSPSGFYHFRLPWFGGGYPVSPSPPG